MSESIHAEVLGKQPNSTQVLLLHGWGSSAELMKPLANRFEEKFEVHSIDLPGHGKSPVPEKAMGVPESAQVVADYIASNMRSPVHVIGHSNGGRISLYMAANSNFSNLIDKLVLISPSGVRRKRSAKFYFRKYLAKTLKFPFVLLPPQLREPGMARMKESLVWKSLGSSDYRSLKGTMRETFVKTVNFYLEDLLPKVQSSVLLFRGSEDQAISNEQMKQMVNLLPDAGYIELPGANHFGYLSHTDLVVRSTESFLSSD